LSPREPLSPLNRDDENVANAINSAHFHRPVRSKNELLKGRFEFPRRWECLYWEMTMRKLVGLGCVAALFTLPTALSAQQYARPQDGFRTQQYSGQYSGQYFGQYDGRVDGRANRKEGLPPSASDKAGPFAFTINPSDCVEVDSIAPNARPRWQSRVRDACQ
jgi:hypothetical protein